METKISAYVSEWLLLDHVTLSNQSNVIGSNRKEFFCTLQNDTLFTEHNESFFIKKIQLPESLSWHLGIPFTGEVYGGGQLLEQNILADQRIALNDLIIQMIPMRLSQPGTLIVIQTDAYLVLVRYISIRIMRRRLGLR